MNSHVTVTTGLLSDGQRAFLRGERAGEITNPEQYQNKIRHQARQRASMVHTDVQLLEAHGHEDIVAEFYYDILLTRLFHDLGGGE